MEKLLLDEREAMAVIGIKRTAFRGYMLRGDIVSIRLGRRRLYPADSLRQFVERMKAEAEAGARQ